MKPPAAWMRIAIAVAAVLWPLALPGAEGNVIPLAGAWSFRLDPRDQGVASNWAAATFHETVLLPGCLQKKGKGFTNVTPEFPSLEHSNRRDHYGITAFPQPEQHTIGAAWYAREVEIPGTWFGRRIVLFLERCHWETRLWVDGQEAGRNDGLGVPHEYELTSLLSPGRHRLVLRADNARVADVGGIVQSVSNQTAGTCNGVEGRIELRSTPKVWIEDVQVFPDLAGKSARLILAIGNRFAGSGDAVITVQATSFNAPNIHRVPERRYTTDLAMGETRAEFVFPMGDDVRLWHEFNPVLYRLKVTLTGVVVDRPVSDETEVTFGMREIRTAGTRFEVNGRPVFLCDNVDWEVFPRTGCVPMTIDAWRRIWAVHKACGFNQARFHSWCPPEAAFQAADEAGIYLAPEVSGWTHVETPALEDFLRRESEAMLRRYGNHPSFVMMALGNQSGGDTTLFQRLLAEWQKDPRRAYSRGSGVVKAGSAP